MDFMQKVIVRKPDDCTRFKELRMRHNDYISFCEMKRFSRGGGESELLHKKWQGYIGLYRRLFRAFR